jgi:hypothetical protein
MTAKDLTVFAFDETLDLRCLFAVFGRRPAGVDPAIHPRLIENSVNRDAASFGRVETFPGLIEPVLIKLRGLLTPPDRNEAGGVPPFGFERIQRAEYGEPLCLPVIGRDAWKGAAQERDVFGGFGKRRRGVEIVELTAASFRRGGYGIWRRGPLACVLAPAEQPVAFLRRLGSPASS